MRAGKLKTTLKTSFMLFALIIIQLSLIQLSLFSGIPMASAASDELEIEILIGGLNAQDVDVKADSVKVLVEIGEPAVEPLIQILGAEDTDTRENAAIALGKIKDQRAVQPLIGLLTDEEWEVESAATNALVEIGEPAVEPLIRILLDENEDTFLQTKVIAVLAGIKDERAISPMIQALKEKPELQADLGYHLGLMGEPAVEPLIQLLGNEDPEVRRRAAEALGRAGDEHAVEPLTDALNDEDERVRLFAKKGLEKIEAQKKSTLIAKYGIKREFYIEAQRREWFEQLHTICDISRNNMKLYSYPEGPVVSYGCSIENCVTVGVLEGSEINNSTLDNIYNIFDQAGSEIGVNDVPVVFSYEGLAQLDEGIPEEIEEIELIEKTEGAEEANKTEGLAEDARIPVNTPGFRAILILLGVLLSVRIISRS